MKIERVRLERRSIELDPPFHAAWDPEPRRSFEATLVLVETDEGLTGIGTVDTMNGFERYEHLFVGQDPLAVERHVAVLETITFPRRPLLASWRRRSGSRGGRGQTAAELGGQLDRVAAYASTESSARPASAQSPRCACGRRASRR